MRDLERNRLLVRCLKQNVANGLLSTASVLVTPGLLPIVFLNLKLLALQPPTVHGQTHEVAVSRAVPFKAFSGMAFGSLAEEKVDDPS